MAIKKSELYSALWKSCDELRGGMGASQYKDDVYLLVSDGWQAASAVRQLVPSKDKNGKRVYNETHDFMFDKLRYKADLIPPALIVARYFAAEQAALASLEAEVAAIEQQMEELLEEHGGKEGLLAEVTEDGKIAKGAVTDRLKEIKSVRAESIEAQERTLLIAYQFLIEQQTISAKKTQGCKAVARHAGVHAIRQIDRGRNQDAGGGRQMARRHFCRSAGRTESRWTNPHRTHQDTR